MRRSAQSGYHGCQPHPSGRTAARTMYFEALLTERVRASLARQRDNLDNRSLLKSARYIPADAIPELAMVQVGTIASHTGRYLGTGQGSPDLLRRKGCRRDFRNASHAIKCARRTATPRF